MEEEKDKEMENKALAEVEKSPTPHPGNLSSTFPAHALRESSALHLSTPDTCSSMLVSPAPMRLPHPVFSDVLQTLSFGSPWQ